MKRKHIRIQGWFLYFVFAVFFGISSSALANISTPALDPYYLGIKKIIISAHPGRDTDARELVMPGNVSLESVNEVFKNLKARLQEKIGSDIEVGNQEDLVVTNGIIPEDVLVITISNVFDYQEINGKGAYMGAISLSLYRNESKPSKTPIQRYNANVGSPYVFKGSTVEEFAKDAHDKTDIFLDNLVKRINHY